MEQVARRLDQADGMADLEVCDTSEGKAGSGDHGGHPGRVCLLEGKWFSCSQAAF